MNFDDYTHEATRLIETTALRDMPEGKLIELGHQYAKEAGAAQGTATASHAIPFGAIAKEALRRYPEWDWKHYGHRRKPIRAEFLESLFACSARWAYQCMKAHTIVTDGDWQAVHDNYFAPTHSDSKVPHVTVESIVKYHRQWMNAGQEQPKRDSIGKRYKQLKAAIETAESLDQLRTTLAQIESVK